MNKHLTLSIKDICLVKTKSKKVEDVLKFNTEHSFDIEEGKCSDNPKYILTNIIDSMENLKKNWSSFSKLRKDPRFPEIDEYVNLYNRWGNESLNTYNHCRKIPFNSEKFKQFIYDIDSLDNDDVKSLIKIINNAYTRTDKDAKLYKYTEDFIDYLQNTEDLNNAETDKVISSTKNKTNPFIKLNTNLGRLKQRHNI